MADENNPGIDIREQVVVNITKIDPLQHIVEHMPAAEGDKDVGKWFKTERMELNFGDYVGRPDENATLHKETLSQLFQAGWYVTEVKESASEGEWRRVVSSSGSASATSSSSSTAKQSSESASESTAETSGQSASDAKSNSYSNSTSVTNSSSGSGSSTGNSSGTTIGNGGNSSTGTTSNSGTESAKGKSSSTGTETATGSSTEESTDTEETTDPYWCAYSLIRLERRRMQSEEVLKDMIKSFVDAYNEGRRMNVDRYDELVALYALLVNENQDEIISLSKQIDMQPLFDAIKAAIEAALAKLGNAVENLPEDWMASRIAEINRKFDALRGQKMSETITNGLYNTTVWASIDAGIERERQYALNDLKDEMVTLKVDTYGKIAQITADVGNNLIAAQTRIFEALMKQKIEPINLRNTVFKWMLDFMEKRTDAYPGLGDITTVAEKLGYSGAIVAPDSVVSVQS